MENPYYLTGEVKYMIQGIIQSKIIFENQNNDFEAIKEALETFKKDFSIDFNSESLISVL